MVYCKKDKDKSAMKIDSPTATIKRQTQTSTPTVSDGTLVDDTVALVDSTSLVGGQTVINPTMPMKIKTSIPRPKIRKRYG